ncbi:hypothetical protein IJ102_00595 [Candidatus Saccharibacteria bacterium]|nr:hypothetical protein [Candidatus Saccharibacteria bacterium]
MTTNILLGMGVIWSFVVAIVVKLVVIIAICREIAVRISNGSLSFLATCIVVATSLATTAILVISATSFLSECFSEEKISGILIALIMFAVLSAIILITLRLRELFEHEAGIADQSAHDRADTTDEGEAKAAKRRVRTSVDYGHYLIG